MRFNCPKGCRPWLGPPGSWRTARSVDFRRRFEQRLREQRTACASCYKIRIECTPRPRARVRAYAIETIGVGAGFASAKSVLDFAGRLTGIRTFAEKAGGGKIMMAVRAPLTWQTDPIRTLRSRPKGAKLRENRSSPPPRLGKDGAVNPCHPVRYPRLRQRLRRCRR